MDEARKKRAAIIAADDFEDLELYYPMYRLQEEGVETVVVGLSKDPYQRQEGIFHRPTSNR